MELRQLSAFVAVAEELSFRRAAERCFVTTPTISSTIRQLERDLGVQLFERSSRGVTVTSAGEALLPASREALAAAAKVRVAARAAQGHHRVRVGTLFGMGAPLVECAVSSMADAGKEPALVVESFGWEDSTCGLANRNVDVAILAGPTAMDDDFDRIRIGMERRVALVATHLAPPRDEGMTLGDLDAIGWVRIVTRDPVWKRYWRLDEVRGGPPPERGARLRSPHSLILAIRRGEGTCTTVAALKDQFSFEGLKLVPLVDVPPIPIDLAYRRGVVLESHVQQFVAAIQSCAGPFDVI